MDKDYAITKYECYVIDKLNTLNNPATETENGIEPRYYIATKNIIGYYKPEVFTVLNPESEV